MILAIEACPSESPFLQSKYAEVKLVFLPTCWPCGISCACLTTEPWSSLAGALSGCRECYLKCRKCEGHEDAVRVLAVAAGKVFSGSYDGTIGVW